MVSVNKSSTVFVYVNNCLMGGGEVDNLFDNKLIINNRTAVLSVRHALKRIKDLKLGNVCQIHIRSSLTILIFSKLYYIGNLVYNFVRITMNYARFFFSSKHDFIYGYHFQATSTTNSYHTP